MKKSAALQQQVKEYPPVTDWTVCVNMSELQRDIRRKEHCWGKNVGERRNTNVLEEGSSTHSNPPWHWSWHKTEVCGCRNICSMKECLWSFSWEDFMHQRRTYSDNITAKISHKTSLLEFWKTKWYDCNFTFVWPLMCNIPIPNRRSSKFTENSVRTTLHTNVLEYSQFVVSLVARSTLLRKCQTSGQIQQSIMVFFQTLDTTAT